MSSCVVCGKVEAIMHGHHTVPQCYEGGKDSLVVNLCPTCHNLVHAKANSILAYKTKNNVVKQFWDDAEVEEKANTLIGIILEADKKSTLQKSAKMIIEFEPQIYSQLKFLQREFGQSSLEKTVKQCIQYTCNKISTTTISKKSLW